MRGKRNLGLPGELSSSNCAVYFFLISNTYGTWVRKESLHTSRCVFVLIGPVSWISSRMCFSQGVSVTGGDHMVLTCLISSWHCTGVNCGIAPQRRWFMIRLIWFILRGPVSWISSRMCLLTGWNGQGRVACRWSSCVYVLWCLQGLSACVKKINLDHLHCTIAPLRYCTTEATIHDSPRDVSVTRGISWRWNVWKPNPTSVVWGGRSWLVSSGPRTPQRRKSHILLEWWLSSPVIPCSWIGGSFKDSMISMWFDANHWASGFQDMRSKRHLQCEGLSSQFLVFKIPDPTLATCYSEIRPGDPLHSEFFASFQGVTPFGCTFCNFFSGWEQSICLVGNLTWCMSLFSSVWPSGKIV